MVIYVVYVVSCKLFPSTTRVFFIFFHPCDVEVDVELKNNCENLNSREIYEKVEAKGSKWNQNQEQSEFKVFNIYF